VTRMSGGVKRLRNPGEKEGLAYKG
jgi:hypothetical protein